MNVAFRAIIITACSVLISCSTIESGMEAFSEQRDSEIGSKANLLYLPEPDQVRKGDLNTDEYHFSFDEAGDFGTCSWYYDVNPGTNEIVAWHYSSDPRACTLRISWGAPW